MKLEQRAVRSGNDRTLDAVLHSDVTGNHSSRSAVQMIKGAGKALVGTAVLAALAGCATQDTFGLPDLTPRGAPPTAQVYSNYSTGYGFGYGYGYPNGYRQGYGYGYPSDYRPGYGYPHYAALGPYPYAYGYGYNPYPRYVVVPCPDNNRDGRCDSRPRKDTDHQGDGHDGSHDRDVQPRRQRDARGTVPRTGNGEGEGIAPTARSRTSPEPAPVLPKPARVQPEPRRATPPDTTTPRGPRPGSGRSPMTGDDVTVPRPTQEP